MAFKIPDSKKTIGVSGNWGTFDYPVPEANGSAAVFRFHGTSPITPTYPGIELIPASPAIDAAVLGRRLTFNNLNLTGVTSVDVNMMLATPTNPLGANLSTNAVFERVFGSPLDTNGPLVNATATATYYTNRMNAAKIYYRLDDESDIAIPSGLAVTGTLINTTALVAYANLSPTSPLRTFSPYPIPIPAPRQKDNVTLHIYQGFPGTDASPSSAVVWGNGNTTSPSVNFRVGASLTTGYGWAVNSINLGANNGGVYTFTKSRRFVSGNTNSSTPAASPDQVFAPGVFYEFTAGTPVYTTQTNAFFDSTAILIDPQASFSKYFDNSFANTSGLQVSDKIVFTNTSITEKNLGVLTDLDNRLNENTPFRGDIGYIGKTAMTYGVGAAASYVTKFNYSNDNWQTVTIPTNAIVVKTLGSGRVPRVNYKLNSALPLVPLYNTPTAGSAYFDQLYTWDAEELLSDYMENEIDLYGHSAFYGYHFKMAGIGGSAYPVPMSIAIGYTPVEATTQGPAAAANRIRGNLIRFPFANYIDLSEVADTSPTQISYSTWSGINATYVYGGVGQPAFSWPVWYGGSAIRLYEYAVAPLGSSFKFPFATITPVTMTATGTGLLSTYSTAVTNQDGAFVLSYRYHEGTVPATVDTTPLLNGTSAYADDIIYAGYTGSAADPSGFPAALTGFTTSANRRMQKFPFATETFIDYGDINNASGSATAPVYVSAARSAGSDSSAYFSVESYVHDTPAPPTVYQQSSTWFKFPYATTTTVAGFTTWAISTPFNYRYFDSGINNTQSPDVSYTGSKKFPFASEIIASTSEEYFAIESLNSNPAFGGAESWPNISSPTLIRTIFGAINQ